MTIVQITVGFSKECGKSREQREITVSPEDAAKLANTSGRARAKVLDSIVAAAYTGEPEVTGYELRDIVTVSE